MIVLYDILLFSRKTAFHHMMLPTCNTN